MDSSGSDFDGGSDEGDDNNPNVPLVFDSKFENVLDV